jgi:hypothetical protein
MNYLPVEFDLHDFHLSLNTNQSAKFHKRLKELGFDSVQTGDTLVYSRGKSRITAFVQDGSNLNFLPDFYDDTPGGTVYAIMEKMCVSFEGTMIGQYSVPSLGNTWDVRISQGMNLSGRPNVGNREHVMDDPNAPATPSTGAVSSSGAVANQTATQAPTSNGQSAGSVGGGQVQGGQSGESPRDKLYRLFVEEAYQKHAATNGDDPSHFIQLVQNFNTQFPQETEEEKKRETIINALAEYAGVSTDNESTIVSEIQLLMNNGESPIENVADELELSEEEVLDVFGSLIHGNQATPDPNPISAGQQALQNISQQITQAAAPYVGQQNNAQTQAQLKQAMNQSLGQITGANLTAGQSPTYTTTPNSRTMPANWTFEEGTAQDIIRQIGAYVYYNSLNISQVPSDIQNIIHDQLFLLEALARHDRNAPDEELFEFLDEHGYGDLQDTLEDMAALTAEAKVNAGL